MKNSLVKSDNSRKTLTDFQSFENGIVDVKDIDGELWFCAKDVADAIEYKGNLNHWERWLDKEDKLIAQNGRSGQARNMTYISESALYRVLIKTDVPKAKPFERWVTKEVIPSIRKNGSYNISVSKVDERLVALEEKKTGLERAKLLRELAAEYNGNSKTWKQILDAHATKELTGEFLLPLPEVTGHGKTAEMIGKPYGLSCQKVGAIIKKLGITKTDDNGFSRVNKAKNCNREVETFYYNESAEKKIVEEIEREEEKCQKK